MHSRASAVLCLALVFMLATNKYLGVVAQTTPAEAPESAEAPETYPLNSAFAPEPFEVEAPEPSEVEAPEPSEVEAPVTCARNQDCEVGEFCFEEVCISIGGDDDDFFGGDDDEGGRDD